MNKREINISSLAELKQEELKVRQRIKSKEAELVLRLQQLPGEIITGALVKLVSGIFEGNTIKKLVNFAKKVGKNILSNVFKDIA